MTKTQEIPVKFAGCWFDGARGIYMGEAVIEEARAHGWNWKESGYEESDFKADSECYCKAWNDADQFLSSLAPEGYWIGSNESGDFGMWACEEEEETA